MSQTYRQLLLHVATSAALVWTSVWTALSIAQADEPLVASIEVETLPAATDDGTYWMQARPGKLPTQSPGDPPQVVITLQKTDRKGTHMYHGLAEIRTADLGQTWTGPKSIATAARRTDDQGFIETPVDFTPAFHHQSGKLLATGATFLLDPKLRKNVPRGPSDTAYTVFDPQAKTWSEWGKLTMPDDPKFYFARAGCTQRVDLPDGDILLPIYFYAQGPGECNFATVVRCRFDGVTLQYQEHGTELTVDVDAKRRRTGLYEPSLVKFGEKFYLTLRADEGAYVAVSDDGLHFSNPQPWKFDDGTLLGSYNTQQHWIEHGDGLFLAYTRRGANNDKIMRHRAPLFMARVDPERLVVLRETEQELLPNLGKPFGNFGICNLTLSETWVVDCLVRAKPGEPNVYLARIHWSKPNLAVD